MSTRSGKRIHNSFHEDLMNSEPDHATKSERNTRSKRLKGNNEQLNMTMPKSKIRKNYVSYPTDDERVDDAGLNDAKNKNITLKEQNINIQSADTEDIVVGVTKPNRITRQTRKFPIDNSEDCTVGDHENAEVLNGKKNKKKKGKNAESLNEHDTATAVAEKASKKTRKIKKCSNSILKVDKKKLNKSNNISTDSFYSAAGSPLKENINNADISIGKSSENQLDNISFEKESHEKNVMNTTFEKETRIQRKSSIKNSTFEKIDITITPAKERKSSIKNSTFDKIDNTLTPGEVQDTTFNIDSVNTEKTDKLNTTFEKEPNIRHSQLNSNVTDVTVMPSESSLISSDSTVNVTFDKSDNSRISITSDDSKTENIINTTPVLIESSMDESKHSEQFNISNKTNTPEKSIHETLPSLTPLKRDGTFTKEGPEVITTSLKPKISSDRTPTKRISVPSPGFTPYRVSQGSQSVQKDKKTLLNVTRSTEKPTRRSSLAEMVPRHTRVMFCSPVNNPGLMTQQKKKIIKSSLKGSNKSFIFEDSGTKTSEDICTTLAARPAARKRSFTQGNEEESCAKRKRLADGLQLSVNRLSRPKTSSASAKLAESTPTTKPVTSSKSPSEVKRTKLPNFTALHQKQFERMESLDECQLRKARRARQLLTPNGPRGTSIEPKGSSTESNKPTEEKKTKQAPNLVTTLPTTAPKDASTEPKGSSTESKETAKEKETKLAPNVTTLPTLESLLPGYTRFGFRMTCDVNPFSTTKSKTGKEKANGLPTQMEKTNRLTSQNEKICSSTTRKDKTNGVTNQKEKTNSLTTLKEKPNGLATQKEKPNGVAQPSSKGATVIRKAVAKQIVMREKSFSSLSNRRESKRNENRTIIKGVRTNRRFELQMKMRNFE